MLTLFINFILLLAFLAAMDEFLTWSRILTLDDKKNRAIKRRVRSQRIFIFGRVAFFLISLPALAVYLNRKNEVILSAAAVLVLVFLLFYWTCLEIAMRRAGQ